MSGPELAEKLPSLSEPGEGYAGSPTAAERVGAGASTLWISAALHPAPAGGLESEPQKIYRLYGEVRLSLRMRRKKRKYARVVRVPPTQPTRPDERWAIGFMSDALISGRKFRVLTVIDVYTREALAVSARTSFPASEVTAVLDRICFNRSKPEMITLDNGTEFTGKHFDAWAYQRGIKLDFIRPGKPVENCYIESFNGRVRDECLSVHWFQ